MKAYLALTFIMLCTLPSLVLRAQHVTVVDHFSGDTTGRGMDEFRLQKSTEQKIIINYYELIETSETDRLEELITASLNFYIDHGIVRDKNRYKLVKPRKQMMDDMNEIVRNAVKFYNFKEVQPFKGFSERIDQRIAEIEQQDLNKMDWAKSTRDENKLMNLAYVHTQKELRSLKDLAKEEVKQFSNDNLVSLTETETTFTNPETSEEIIADWIKYDEEYTLPLSTNHTGETEYTLLGIEDRSTLTPQNQNPKGSAANEVFMQQMLEMMQLNNAETRAMREEFNDFRDQQLAMWKSSEEKNNANLQSQIDDLKGMIVDIVRYNKGEGSIASNDPLIITPSPDNTGKFPSNLPRFVNVYFSSGSSKLNAVNILSLNEIVDILARNAHLNIIVTGYADGAGDEMTNLLLSQERARSVKKFLSQSGLEDSRFITKYYGEKDSLSENPSDRRVMMEFVMK